MVQGTASSVGKSLMAAALCRIFTRQGLRVAPFKAQNMALNSAVTPDGAEIGRAQMVQAEAARAIPHADMNPVLLKPEGERRSQVVVNGRPVGSMDAVAYHAYKCTLRRQVLQALTRLRRQHDLVIIEGAGSPAEINLRERDIVNMFVARAARAPVLLVGDIDRGGVFAAFVGTMELLRPQERARVAAFVVNKFRGDVSLLQPGLDFLTARTGTPVLGVVPYVPRLRVAEEDSVSLDHRQVRQRPEGHVLDIVVVRLPRISNYDDVEPLEHEPGVQVRFAEHADAVRGADLVILPGSKNTLSDLAWLRQSGIAAALLGRAARGEPVLGICGGCQMLGETIHDPHGVESPLRCGEGLGLLPLRTDYAREKITAQVQAKVATTGFLGNASTPVQGYEIHMGIVTPTRPARPAFTLHRRSQQDVSVQDGAVSADGSVLGTMLHGIFENQAVRKTLLHTLRTRRNVPPPATTTAFDKHAEYDRLADNVQNHVDMDFLQRLIASQRAKGSQRVRPAHDAQDRPGTRHASA